MNIFCAYSIETEDGNWEGIVEIIDAQSEELIMTKHTDHFYPLRLDADDDAEALKVELEDGQIEAMGPPPYCTECGKACSIKPMDTGIGPYEFWGCPFTDVYIIDVSDCCEAECADSHMNLLKGLRDGR